MQATCGLSWLFCPSVNQKRESQSDSLFSLSENSDFAREQAISDAYITIASVASATGFLFSSTGIIFLTAHYLPALSSVLPISNWVEIASLPLGFTPAFFSWAEFLTSFAFTIFSLANLAAILCTRPKTMLPERDNSFDLPDEISYFFEKIEEPKEESACSPNFISYDAYVRNWKYDRDSSHNVFHLCPSETAYYEFLFCTIMMNREFLEDYPDYRWYRPKDEDRNSFVAQFWDYQNRI